MPSPSLRDNLLDQILNGKHHEKGTHGHAHTCKLPGAHREILKREGEEKRQHHISWENLFKWGIALFLETVFEFYSPYTEKKPDENLSFVENR